MIVRKIAIYTRCSTSNQSVESQTHTLREVAQRSGNEIVLELTDTISGATDSRVGLDSLLKAATQRKFDVLYVYSIDRLGRSTKHLISVVEKLKELNIELFFYREGIDTSTATGKCVFSIMASIAELERNLIRERVCAGLEKAKRNNVKLGRPSVMNDSLKTAVILLKEKGMSVKNISKELKCGVGTVYSILEKSIELKAA
jgi:DNA invertase Pin-like site-specific DNA recombinase